MPASRLGKALADTGTILGITLLLLILLELVVRLTVGLPDSGPHRLAGADSYGSGDRATELWREMEDSRATVGWQPFVYWRRLAYQGDFVNVDEAGRRVTPRPAGTPESGAQPLRIFFFGGSTMWGYGTPDAATIPALAWQRLAAAGVVAEVTNFGETGYVSNQEVITLLRELQRGNVPDIVVFMDGVNDTFSTFQNREAGISQNEQNRIREFNLLQDRRYGDLVGLALRNLPKNLALREWLKAFGDRRKEDADPAPSSPLAEATPEDAALARDTLEVLLANRRAVDALGGTYGFRTLWYWQPTVFDKPQRTPWEENERRLAAAWEPFFRETYAQAARLPQPAPGAPGITDISGLLAQTAGPAFVDWCHLSAAGNERIAARMAEDLGALLGSTARRP